MKHRSTPPGVHLNLNIRDLRVSATMAVQEISSRLKSEGKLVFKLGLGQSPFPVPRPVVEELRANAHQKDYLPVRGLTALREAISEYHRKRSFIPCSAEDVIIGPGSKELMFILQLVFYGDLLIPSPSWVSYAPQARIVGRPVHWIATDSHNGYRLTPEIIEAECCSDPDRPRLLILNYPNNPTGLTYNADELRAIARVARRHRIVLLSDEIYGEINHSGRHVSVARFYPEGTIVSGGLSKWCGAGGWRLGAFVFPESLRWLLDSMAVVASETFTATSAPIQHAAVRAFQGGTEIERYLAQSRRILKDLGRHMQKRLDKAGVRTHQPQGGFYLFPDFSAFSEKLAARGVCTSQDLCARLLEETGVAVLPGSAFGRPPEELTVRAAYVDFDGARALAAAEQAPADGHLDSDFLTTYCGNLTEATDRICQWVE